jgi:hypothetical protein
MLFGRVRGTAICTIKYPDLKGMKLLVVESLDRHLEPVGGKSTSSCRLTWRSWASWMSWWCARMASSITR